MRREGLRDRLVLRLHQFESQTPQWGVCITHAARGKALHFYTAQVRKNINELRPSSLAFLPLRGSWSKHGPLQLPPRAFHVHVGLVPPGRVQGCLVSLAECSPADFSL